MNHELVLSTVDETESKSRVYYILYITMIRCLNYPKSVYYFIFETSLPQIIHHLSSFFQYSGRKRFLCTSEGDTELGNISSKTKLSWKYILKSWRHLWTWLSSLDSNSCFTSLKVHKKVSNIWTMFPSSFMFPSYFWTVLVSFNHRRKL